jgi:hypothetical protein
MVGFLKAHYRSRNISEHYFITEFVVVHFMKLSQKLDYKASMIG